MERPRCGNFLPDRGLMPTVAGKMDRVLAPMETVLTMLEPVESSSRRPPFRANGFAFGEPTAKLRFAVPKFNLRQIYRN